MKHGEWMNEWWPFIPIHTDLCEHTDKEPLRSLDDSLNKSICLTAVYITDGSYWREIGITFIKCLSEHGPRNAAYGFTRTV